MLLLFDSLRLLQDWGLTFKYEEDAAKVREHMLLATGLGKGAPKMEAYGKNMKKEVSHTKHALT